MIRRRHQQQAPRSGAQRSWLWLGVAAAILGICLPCFSRAAEAEPATLAKQIDEAVAYLTYSNFDRAYQSYHRLVKDVQPSDGEAWQQITFGLALAAHYRTPPTPALIEEAKTRYRSIVELAPDCRFAPRSMLNLGRIAEMRDYGGDASDPESARTFYRAVFERWPALDVADEAALRYADTYVQSFDEHAVREGAAFLQSWVEAHGDRVMASVIWEYLGQVRLVILKDYAGAIHALIRADELGLMDLASAGEVYWNIASVAHHELDDPALAVRYYRKIILETPKSGNAFEAQLALFELRDSHPTMQIEVPEIPNLLHTDPMEEDQP